MDDPSNDPETPEASKEPEKEPETKLDREPAREQDKEPDLGQRIAGYTYRTLRWGRDHVPPGVRSLIGVLFMIGGVFGFLPILGFWMFPLGVAFVALDVPPARKAIERWMVKLAKQAGNALTDDQKDPA